MKDVNFRRNLFINHGLVTAKKEKILELYHSLKSDGTFYSVIEWIFEAVDDHKERKKIFSFIENKYPLMPAYLKDRIILYYEIYHYLSLHNLLPVKNCKSFTFHEFLAFKDNSLFKHLF